MINWDRINELQEEVGEDDLSEVLALFCEEMEDALVALNSSRADNMPSQLHFLKGSALTIGLEGLSRLCQEAEAELAADPSASTDIRAIRDAYQAGKDSLSEILK